MTAEGHSAMMIEVKHLKTVERPRIIKAIEEARAHGDLSENAEYHAAKEQQGWTEARVAELEDKLSRAEIIDISKLSGDTVMFGAKVTLAVRPERIDLVRPGTEAHLGGTVQNIVYFGTDTTFHVALDGSGQEVTVRVQNRRGDQEVLKVGDAVGLRIAPEAMQILKD